MTRTRSEASVEPSPLAARRHLRRPDPGARRVEARAGQERPAARRPPAAGVHDRGRAREGRVRRGDRLDRQRRDRRDRAALRRRGAVPAAGGDGRRHARPTSSGSDTARDAWRARARAGTASRSCGRPARSATPRRSGAPGRSSAPTDGPIRCGRSSSAGAPGEDVGRRGRADAAAAAQPGSSRDARGTARRTRRCRRSTCRTRPSRSPGRAASLRTGTIAGDVSCRS